MNVYERAINKKYHISKLNYFHGQRWEDFEKSASEKKIIIYGVSPSIEAYSERFGHIYPVDKIIDGNYEKIGKEYDDRGADYKLQIKGENIVYAPSILDEYDANNTVVLISSIRYYDEIAEELFDLGFNNIYSIIVMESNSDTLSRFKKKDLDFADYCSEKYKTIQIDDHKISFIIGVHGSHGVAITQKLLEKNNDLQIVWLLKDCNIYYEVPNEVSVISKNDLEIYIYQLMTSRMILIDEIAIDEIKYKRSGQTCVQLKHWSSITLKKFGIAETMNMSLPGMDKYVQVIHETNLKTDYIFVGSKFDEESCREGFEFNGNFVKIGSPRSDVVFDCRWKNIIKNKYDISSDSKILLYAPTYRYLNGFETNECVHDDKLDYSLLKESLENAFGGKWYIFLRLHPLVAESSFELEYPEYVINVSDYPDSMQLVSASDIMISDYSSIMFETAYLYRPVFLFAFDRKQYIGVEKDLLLDYDELPFPIAENNNELSQIIIEFDKDKYNKSLQSFFDFHQVTEDGHASERASQKIIELLEL